MSEFELKVAKICSYALIVIEAHELKFRPMRRNGSLRGRRSYAIGRINLRTKLISIDILTPLKREPRKISSILAILCHEAAHSQKPPFRQRYKGKMINRQHYPEFYKQVTDNLNKLKKDIVLGKFFK